MILISGGAADPNIACLVSRASRLNAKFEVVYAGVSRIDWAPGRELLADKKAVQAKAMFQRFNTFGYDVHNSSHWNWYQNWYHIMRAAGLSLNWKMFDAKQRFEGFCKPLDLILAKEVGFRVPETLITDNEIPHTEHIFKPVMGGDHTKILRDASDFARGAGIIQPRLTGQEYRAYVVGDEVFAYRMDTSSLDYREKQDVRVVPVPLSDIRVAEKVRQLSHRKGLYFSATDLKEDADGQIHFLEINSSPMFSEFDRVSCGQLTEAMLAWLGV